MTAVRAAVPEPVPVSRHDMRAAMGRYLSGVAVVTTLAGGGRPTGMTVNSLTSVSLDPPVLLVCLTESARSAAAVLAAGRFAVSVLAVDQEPIAARFAARGADHFAGLAPVYEGHAVPVVPGALAHLECSVAQAIRVGDHDVIFGGVLRTCYRDGVPLAFHAGRFGRFGRFDREEEQELVPWLG
jgi:flavin reductase (DIM6/NTAB) family NADH-FMN oxidoreductase RutF